MRIVYNSIKQHIKEQGSQIIFAYGFMAFAGSLLLWHIIDKIIKFSTVSSELELIFT